MHCWFCWSGDWKKKIGSFSDSVDNGVISVTSITEF